MIRHRCWGNTPRWWASRADHPPVTSDVLLAAGAIMKSLVTSLFDAIYAAGALDQDADRTILSTDEVYDKVAGIKRVDPRGFIQGTKA